MVLRDEDNHQAHMITIKWRFLNIRHLEASRFTYWFFLIVNQFVRELNSLRIVQLLPFFFQPQLELFYG